MTCSIAKQVISNSLFQANALTGTCNSKSRSTKTLSTNNRQHTFRELFTPYKNILEKKSVHFVEVEACHLF
jgi:hypothetical protein